MDKIEFKDGQLVKEGYVEIDGVQHPVVPPEYEGETPFSAYIMNLMQSNMEKAGVVVSYNEPTGEEKVWLKPRRNLLPIDVTEGNYNGLTVTKSSSGAIHIVGTTTARTLIDLNQYKPIKLLQGNYILQKEGDNVNAIEVYIRTLATPANVITSMAGTGTKKTFNNTYLEDVFAYLAISANKTLDIVLNISLGEGTEEFQYEEYEEGAERIFIKNANNVLREFRNGEIVTTTDTNGTAIKFPDGTMICTLNITVTDQAINTALGSIYKGNRVWNYPEPFIEMPVVTCGQFKWSTGSSWGGVAGTNHLRATLTGYDCYSRAAGPSCTIQATAIGRWK